MKKFSLKKLLLAIVMTPFFVFAQNNVEPVADVVATKTGDSNVEILWSWDKIIPEIVSVDFETGDLSQADFYNDETYPWSITTDAYEGSYAIKSTCEGVSDGISAIEITVDVPYDAIMSFYHKIDCEYYFDNGRFFIDGVERALVTDNVDWEYKEFHVSKGVHTYRWTYRKDVSDYGSSTDAYFVDNIVLYKRIPPFAGGWISYDDDHYVQTLGSETGTIDWGICFPDTEEFAGYDLTKVAVYDENAATVYAKIYFGGTDAPATIVSNEEFKLTGSKMMKEFTLATPIPIDGTEPLWITFFSSDPTFVASMCNYVGEEHSDWLSFDGGATWSHMADWKEPQLPYSWLVRGFLQNDRGETAVLNKNRALKNYKVYRKNLVNNDVELLAQNVTDTTYNDTEWNELGFGAYKWGVAASYDEGDAEIVWSNTIDKDIYATLNVNVATNSNDNPNGSKAKFANVNEPDYYYKVVLDETGSYTFDKFRKGTYNITVSLDGFESYTQENVAILDDMNVECVLNEIKAAVENLAVSSTGWATWENATYDNGGGRFFFDFEYGLMDGWTTIDADGDSLSWRLTTEIMGPGYGHNKSKYCVVSQSYTVDSIYNNPPGALTPDNYLVTADKYLITEDSQLSYYVCAQDESSPAEHYSVLVSTESNTDVESFVTLWEETMVRGAKATRNGRGQGAWYRRTIDLRKYAGQEIYIAFRHFNSTNQFYVNLDDIALMNNAKSSRSLNTYTLKLNGEVVATDVKNQYYQFEGLTAGETYTASVVANYTTGDSEATEFTWTYASSDDFAGAVEFKGREVAGKAYLEWYLEGDEIPEDAENSFFFDFNDGTLNGWRNIDADGDGYVWYNSAEKLGPGYGYKDSIYCIVSHSFYSGQFNFPLTPDNYLVTEKRYAITEDSKLSFVVCAQDPSFYEEHYGVAVSLIDNATADDFVTIWEETLESDDTDYQTPQTHWATKTIDLSQYAGEEIYIALRHFNCTDQYMLDIDNVSLTSGVKSDRNESEVLGVMVYCEGELLTPEPITNRSFSADFPGDGAYEYCIRVVYEDFAMSTPQCVVVDAPINCAAPKDLHAEAATTENGSTAVTLTWPYQLPPTSEWLYYDNNTPYTALGLGGSPFYWAIMLPYDKLTEYAGTSITKVMTYDVQPGDATVLISYGSNTQPFSVIHSENFTFTGANDWLEIPLSQAVPVTGKDNIWVMIYQVGTSHPAAVCQDTNGDPNGRWASADGMTWMDVNTMGTNLNYAWILRAFVTNEVKGSAELQEVDFYGEVGDVTEISVLDEPFVATANRDSALDHYNVYRGFDLDDMSVIAETNDGYYYEEISTNGIYYYQVRAVYKDGEETCESEPANSFKNPGQNYVVVEVLTIGENGDKLIMVYPNPTKDNLTVKAENMIRITIMNALGQVVYDENINSDNEVINMNQYDAGMYIVRIATENGTVVRRISKL